MKLTTLYRSLSLPRTLPRCQDRRAGGHVSSGSPPARVNTRPSCPDSGSVVRADILSSRPLHASVLRSGGGGAVLRDGRAVVCVSLVCFSRIDDPATQAPRLDPAGRAVAPARQPRAAGSLSGGWVRFSRSVNVNGQTACGRRQQTCPRRRRCPSMSPSWKVSIPFCRLPQKYLRCSLPSSVSHASATSLAVG